MAAESKTTTDHSTTKKWVEARGGKPATVKRTASENEAGILRINFPGYSGEQSLVDISWDEFFNKFDEKKLAFLYQEEKKASEESRFFRLVSRDGGDGKDNKDEDHHKKEPATASSDRKR